MTDEQLDSLYSMAQGSGKANFMIAARALLATPAPLSDEPVAWQYFDSFGKWTHVDAAQLDWHRNRGFEVRPLYAAPPATPSDKQEAIYQECVNENGLWMDTSKQTYDDIVAGKLSSKGVRVVYAAPLAQSAEQDRIDAERWRTAIKHGYLLDYEIPEIDEFIAKGASK